MFDVLIMGGGLAGLTLARQLRRDSPERSVALIDRQARPLPEAAHKVGESSVELGSCYFERTIGLLDYLNDRHLIKNGLRYFPGGGKTLALAERTEIGPPQLPIVPSYQLDRGRLENDLRAMNEADGVTMIEGVGVEGFELGEPHRVHLADGQTLEGTWLIDATGRRRMLARKLGLTKPSGHLAHAAWFRLDGRLDVDHLVPKSDAAWHAHDVDNIRWLSTSHLMGEGYWVWIIPLSSGLTSIGIVAHGHVHAFDTMNTEERALAWIEEHEPVLADKIAEFQLEDFRCLKDYSYTSERCFSAERWATVGEAGLFVDPFYSPGSDFIALANVFTGQLIARDFAGQDIAADADYYDWWYRRLADLSFVTYKDAAKVYGQPRVLAAKIYWDNFNYWAFICQWYFQRIWSLPLDRMKEFDAVAEEFAQLNLKAQPLLRAWAERATDEPVRRYQVMPPMRSELANLHIDLAKEMTPEETLAYMEVRCERTKEVLMELLLRAVTELGPEQGGELLDEIGARDWGLEGMEARVAIEHGGKRGRRKRLSRTARDVERGLGKITPKGPGLLEVATALFDLPARRPEGAEVAAAPRT